jgi:hypothetical protein
MFGGGTMGPRRLFVPLGGFPVCVVLHGVSSYGSVIDSLLYVHEADQLLGSLISGRERPRIAAIFQSDVAEYAANARRRH